MDRTKEIIRNPPTSSLAVLVSGGLDSLTLLEEALKTKRRVFPLYVRCGFLWEKAELTHLGRFLGSGLGKRIHPLTLLSLPLGDLTPQHWSLTGRGTPGLASRDEAVYLPGRNLFLLGKAGVWCALHKVPELWVGSLKSNPFSDASPRFRKKMSDIIEEATSRPLLIRAPFSSKTKAQVWALSTPLARRWAFSCLNPKGLKPCGRCNKCEERRVVSLLKEEGVHT